MGNIPSEHPTYEQDSRNQQGQKGQHDSQRDKQPSR
jgi:hypothetical protein